MPIAFLLLFVYVFGGAIASDKSAHFKVRVHRITRRITGADHPYGQTQQLRIVRLQRKHRVTISQHHRQPTRTIVDPLAAHNRLGRQL